MRLLGLTGNIACGKSAVARILEPLGAVVIDADRLVHELYTDPLVAQDVAGLFGPRVVGPEGVVDRAQLGRIVFNDGEALRRLESLVHPLVRRLREEKLSALRVSPEPPPAAVIDAVKLVESGQAAGCDAVWCVVCTVEDQLKRLESARGLNRDEALLRLERQPSVEGKRKLLKGIPLKLIHNEGTLEALAFVVNKAWADFLNEAV